VSGRPGHLGDNAGHTRREFVALSASALLGATWMRWPRALDQLLYVGTYTDAGCSEGVYLVRMNSSTGELRASGSVNVGRNPSFLAIDPSGQRLYAVNEVEELDGKKTGALTSCAIAQDTGALTVLNSQPTGGGAPCYVSVDHGGHAALVANYVGGNVALLPIATDGALMPAATVVQHHGSGPVTDRQHEPHAHCIMPDPSNRFALAADLGADRVFVYALAAESGTLRHVEEADAAMRPGAGPRHLAFHPRLPLVFVSNELDSTVSTLRFDGATGRLSLVDTRSTLPVGWKGENSPADIHVAMSGRAVYVSNRGHNSIAAFSVDRAGGLTLQQVISTDGDWPRNFTIDPTGRWLLVANQRSNDLVVFARERDRARLTPTKQRIALPSPVCLRFRARTA
jgi:6-phosphogluconolactonase